jgi:hypothetical protein
VLLPDGSEFVSWERRLTFTKTYYVDNRNPRAADSNPGTKELPFLTINKAAQVLEPGERVVIMGGVYRERVAPARGGTGADKMISYEAAPGAEVIVKGSRVVKGDWEASTARFLDPHLAGSGDCQGQPLRDTTQSCCHCSEVSGAYLDLAPSVRSKVKIYQRHLDDIDFHGYNPFGMVNMMQDRTWSGVFLNPTPEGLRRHLLRRGMVFVDGRRLEQVELYNELGHTDGAFWCEHDGLTIHVRLAGDADPAEHEVELVIQEQVFAPKQEGLSYIRLKGITFEHAASQFPVPQIGMVSASRGNHWIIEDCVMRHVNSVALDIGAQDGDIKPLPITGYSIVRHNHIDDVGVCGLAGMGVQNTLIESNLVEHVGWQDVELIWETAGIKLHTATNCLLRNNIIRHIQYAPGLWLDWLNKNTRVTGNIIGDTLETLLGSIFLEASPFPNIFDHNIVWRATPGKPGSTAKIPPEGGWGISLTGSDETVIAHNLFGYTQDSAVKIRISESRMIGPRGGTARWNKVINNIFYRCGNAIDFPHRDNTAEGNLYTHDLGAVTDEDEGRGRGLNWVVDGNATYRLDLAAWQKFFGFDKNGAYADINIDVDLDALTMTWSMVGSAPRVATEDHFKHDLFGESAGQFRAPGPLLRLPDAPTKVAIDPRRPGRGR